MRALAVAATLLFAIGGAAFLLRPRELPYEPVNGPAAPRRTAADAGARTTAAPPSDAAMREDDLVELERVAPGIVLDVRYATANNFLKEPVYPVARVLLRRGVAERLTRVQGRLRDRGLGLKVFDGYRPLSVQRQMWALVPDERYVADPTKGSRHNRGAAVDVSLVDAAGNDLPMPTDFDDFTARAGADAPAPEPARTNRATLRAAMEAEGFIPMPSEWWHFDAPDWQRYPILDVPLDELR